MKRCQRTNAIILAQTIRRYRNPTYAISDLDGQRECGPKDIRIVDRNLKNKKIFLFGTAGFGGSDAYFEKILGQVKQSIDASNTVIGEYMCQGKMPQSVRERYVKMKENPEHPANLDLLIQNFDRALSHPDSEDLERLKKSL